MLDLAKLRFNNKIGQMKWLGLMAVIWSALVAGSLAWYMRHEQQSILSAATTAATAYIRKDISFRNWAASHGGVYVPPTERTPPNPYLQVPDRDVVTTTGKMLTLMNPAYMLRQMQSDFPDDYGTKSHITSLKPINPNNAPDAWETKALQTFEQGSKEVLEAQQIDGQPYLRMMLPFVVEQGCLKCHAQQGYKLGDIRGGISTSVPLAPFSALEREIKKDLMLSHGAIWLLGLVGLVWLGVLFRRIQRMEISARSAAAVEESERRFRAVTESANDAIISADSAGNVVGWNPGAERLFGYNLAEVNGQPLTVLMPERFHKLHREGLARVAAGGVPHVIGKTVELAGLRKDGSEFQLEVSLAQWQAAEGPFFTAIIRDITERKQAQKALLEERNFAESIISTAQAIVLLLDTEGRIISFNPYMENLSGWRLEEVCGKDWFSIFLPERSREATRKLFQTAIGGTRTLGNVDALLTHDGRELLLEWYDTTLKDSEGKVTGLLAIGQDITERKQAETQLIEQIEELRRWHEATSNREQRILSIKHEVNELLAQAGLPPRYPSAESQDQTEE